MKKKASGCDLLGFQQNHNQYCHTATYKEITNEEVANSDPLLRNGIKDKGGGSGMLPPEKNTTNRSGLISETEHSRKQKVVHFDTPKKRMNGGKTVNFFLQ